MGTCQELSQSSDTLKKERMAVSRLSGGMFCVCSKVMLYSLNRVVWLYVGG